MVNPPEAEPVSAASTLVATASDTSGPPSIPTTQSRTTAKAGKAATTAPKPTRLATLSAGRADALAPASTDWRNAGKRPRLQTTTTTMAAASATTTDQTPATAVIEVPPKRSSDRNEKSSRGKTRNDIVRLTATTTQSGNAASHVDGVASLWWPRWISAGSNSRAVVARSRTCSSSAAASGCAEI